MYVTHFLSIGGWASGGFDFLVRAYLNSNSPLFSMVKDRDFREPATMHPKLQSLMGVMLNLFGR